MQKILSLLISDETDFYLNFEHTSSRDLFRHGLFDRARQAEAEELEEEGQGEKLHREDGRAGAHRPLVAGSHRRSQTP